MSVINQVLVELDRRRASKAERGTLPDHVRALPERSDNKGGWWLAAGGAATIGLLVLAWLAVYGYRFPRPAPVATLSPPGAEAVIEKMVSVSAAGATGIRPVKAGNWPANPLPPAARLSLELSHAPAPQRVAEPPPEPVRTQGLIPAAGVLARAGEERGAPVAPAKDASRPARPAHLPTGADKPAAGASGKEIEKQVRQPSPRELADQEYRKAASLLQQGRVAEAQEGFRAALSLHAGHSGARQALVGLMLQGKSYGEAERALQEGLKLAPEQIGFAMTLARLQVDRGDTAGAIATLQGAAGHAQGSPDYPAFLAALLQRQGRHEDAIEHFSAALRIKPNSGVWWLGLAMSLQAVNRAADAQEAYRRAKTGNLNPELAAFADQRLRQLQ